MKRPRKIETAKSAAPVSVASVIPTAPGDDPDGSIH
jgi:hypothetical protein